MKSGYLDSHNLGHVVRGVMLAFEVSKSQQHVTEKSLSILASSTPAADQAGVFSDPQEITLLACAATSRTAGRVSAWRPV